MAQEEIARIEDEVGRFLERRTKAELWEVALDRGVPLAPVNSLEDLLRDEHLRQRGFWVQVTDRTSGKNATSTSLPFIINNNRPVSGSSMPVAGQHNTAVYGQLGPTHADQQRIHPAVVVSGSRRMDARPLEGVRIVELMRALAGDWATSYLADFGAEVIKVESSAVPDLTRITGPYAGGEPHLDRSYSFAWGNTGKKSIGLDLKTPQGVSLFKRLVASADVVAENLSPGAMERMGLGYEEMVECNSQIIVLSSKTAGGHGPSENFRGFGIQLAAMSSYCELTGWPDREPTQPHIAYTDPIAAWYSVLAILAALEYRKRGSGPQFIDLSHFEAGVSFVSQAIIAHSMEQVEVTRNGNKDANACPHSAYPCRGDDHWIAVAVRNEPEWRAFCTALGKPDWCADPRYVDLRQRKLCEEELDRAIGMETVRYEAYELMELLQRHGVPAGVVQSAEDMLERDEQLRYREFFEFPQQGEIGPVLCAKWSFRLSGAHPPVTPGPVFGDHTAYVCREILKLTDQEVSDLASAGVLEFGL